MRPTSYLLILVSIAMFMFSCSAENFQEDTIEKVALEKAPPAKMIEVEILELINNYRTKVDLPTLSNLNVIKSVAFTHTDYMISVNQVSHINFFKRKTLLEQNVSAIKVTENVAYAYTSAQSVVNAWLNSPGHKANIEGDFTDFDISAEMNSEGKWYFTNIFIKR